MNNNEPFRNGKIRFLVLFLLSMSMFGNQYAFNNPQAMEGNMIIDLNISETQFQLLYTIFAFPNIFATFFIGYLIDYLGVRIGIIALSGGVAFFQLVIAIGGYAYSYETILIGRMLFGLASESLVTAQASFVSFWFKGKELAFALGIAITFPQLGNAFNSLITPIIYDASSSLGTPLLISVFICILSLICAIAASLIDKKADQTDSNNKIIILEDGNSSQQVLENHAPEIQKQNIKMSDLKELTWPFWLLCTLCMFAVGLYVPFMDGANELFVSRYCFTSISAGKALMITYLVAAFCSPPLGILVDKIGHKRYFIMICMLMYIIAQIILISIKQCAQDGASQTASIAGLVFIGFGYCLYGNCVLASIPLVVKKKITGSAFGIMQMIESLALAFFPLINAKLIEHSYTSSLLFFLLIGFLGILVSFGLFFLPEKSKRKLDRISKQKVKVENGKNGELIISESEDESDASLGHRQIEIISQKSQNLNSALIVQQNLRNDDL